MTEEILKLKNIEDDYERAYQLVSITFKDITDKGGKPYIGHLKRVSDKLKKKDTKVAGLLHDILEDIEYISEDTLKELNFNDKIIKMIKIVTRKKVGSYHQFITDIIETNNIEAIKLKYSDMKDNADPERLSRLNPVQKAKLIAKYDIELPRLENAIKELERRDRKW